MQAHLTFTRGKELDLGHLQRALLLVLFIEVFQEDTFIFSKLFGLLKVNLLTEIPQIIHH